ncbi:MAG: beta-ketoacyl-ACP synthase II [Acidobacteriota bacterium]
MKRVVVTGIGIVSPIGVGRENFWSALTMGRSGISRIEAFDTANLKTSIAAVCRDFKPADFFDEREMSRLDRVSQMSIVATKLALCEARLTEEQINNYATGVILGTGFGGQSSIEDFYQAFLLNERSKRSAIAIPKSMYNASAANISMRFKMRGPNITVTTACSSGANAIGIAAHMIRYGQAERMICGGADAPVIPSVMDAWKDMRVLSTQNETPERACRPFSATRDGFVLGEAAGIVVLESLDDALERGATIFAEVLGYGSTADAAHITFPDPEGEAQAILKALQDAQVSAAEIDYINAHGTATKLNDASETEAIKRVFGSRAYEIPISSIKSMLGHSMGASGAVEFIATALAVKEQMVPPTINFEERDPQCDLDYVTDGARPMLQRAGKRTAISNSFGFGGNNAVLVARAYTS